MISKLVKNIASLGIVQLVNYVFPLITIPYISRIIGPDGYGIINYATAFTSYFIMLIGYGFDLTATRRIARDPLNIEYRNRVFSEIINARIILFFFSIFLFLLAIIYIPHFQNNFSVSIILFMSCISTVLTPQYIYQGLQKLSIFAKVNFIKGIISSIMIFLVVIKSGDYVWLVAINVILGLCTSVFFLIHAFKKFRLKIYFVPLKDTLLLLWKERMIFLSTVVISLYTTTNIVLLGFFDNIQNVGYFTISQSFINIISTVLTVPLATALFPFIGSAFSKSKENGVDTVKKILPIVFYIVFVSCLFLFFLVPSIINLFYGNKFNDSVLPMKIMAFLPLIICLSNMFGIQVILNLGLDKLFFRITAICSILGLACNVLMSKYCGYIGTAWNIVIIESIVTIAMYLALKRINIDVVNLHSFKPLSVFKFIKNNLLKEI